jgi:hypothetical protein
MRLRWGQYALKPDVAVQMDLFIDIPCDEDRPARTPRRDESRQLLLFD